MPEETPLTVDLDDVPGMPPFIDRVTGYIERLLQSDFISSDLAREDFENLLDWLRRTRDE